MNHYEVFFQLTRLEIELWGRVDRALIDECGIALGRFEALLALQRLGSCRVQEISRELGITVGGTSKLIDRLEQSGFCLRAPNPDDGRSSLISLSSRAPALIARANAIVDRVLREVFDDALPGGELTAFGTRLLRLRARVADAEQTA